MNLGLKRQVLAVLREVCLNTMGRGRGKGKKQSLREDLGSGEEEKIPPVRRRGRPLKPVKDDVEEEEDEIEKVVEDEEEDDDNSKNSILSKDIKNSENGKKRKRPSQVKENNGDLVKEENGVVGSKTNSDELKRSVGFRQIGSRRKNKPRRAAEVGVECR